MDGPAAGNSGGEQIVRGKLAENALENPGDIGLCGDGADLILDNIFQGEG